MDLAGWTPMYSYFAGGQLVLDWCHTGQRRFTQPFFGDTIDQVTSDHAALLFRHRTTIDEAKVWSRHRPAMPPAGFIFHMSRCGSTLVSRMLAALPENRVLSEPTAINAVIRAALLDARIPRATLVDWLRTLVGMLGCPLDGESRYFLKLDCWHVLALPLIAEAFPETPWIFLYRDPGEILVSQARSPGAWTVTSALEPEIFGVKREDALSMPRSEYLARMLGRMYTAGLEHRGRGRGVLVNYNELPEFVWGRLPTHFGIACSPEELERMRMVSRADAKTPQLIYSDDRPAKRLAVTPELQVIVDEWLAATFERLEAVRMVESNNLS
jgi:hypothetical protein